MSDSIYSLYKTTNLINGKIYIGVHRETKWPEIDDYLGSGYILKQAIIKYGREHFKRKVLCISDNSEYMYQLEKQYVNEKFINEKHTYNLNGGGYGASVRSEETKQKLSKANKGKTLSEETRKKMSKIREGRTISIEQRMAISKANRGNTNAKGAVRSPEHCKRISETHKGKIVSEETRQKLRKANKGKIVSEETRQKLSEKMKQIWMERK